MKEAVNDHIPAMIGCGLSLACAVLAYAIGVGVDVSFFGGLLGVSISLQIDALVGSSSLRRELADVGEVTDTLLRNKMHVPVILSIVRSVDLVTHEERERREALVSAIMPQQAADTLAKCQNDMAALASGSFSTTNYDFRPLNSALRLCRRSLQGVAVHGVDRLTYGSNSVGAAKVYSELQRLLIQRGVSIERIFVYDEPTEDVMKVMNEQRSAGVDVYGIDAEEVPEYLKIDCAIVDATFCGRIEVGSAGGIIGTHYSLNRADVSKRIREFEELKSLAREHQP